MKTKKDGPMPGSISLQRINGVFMGWYAMAINGSLPSDIARAGSYSDANFIFWQIYKCIWEFEIANETARCLLWCMRSWRQPVRIAAAVFSPNSPKYESRQNQEECAACFLDLKQTTGIFKTISAIQSLIYRQRPTPPN